MLHLFLQMCRVPCRCKGQATSALLPSRHARGTEDKVGETVAAPALSTQPCTSHDAFPCHGLKASALLMLQVRVEGYGLGVEDLG